LHNGQTRISSSFKSIILSPILNVDVLIVSTGSCNARSASNVRDIVFA
jgi:hypothetical protein